MLAKNRAMEVLGIEHPIVQAPMAGGPIIPELVAAVSNAGGLGSLGAAYLTPEKLREQVREIRSLTQKPFGVNLFVPSPFEAAPRGSSAPTRSSGGTERSWRSRPQRSHPPSRRASRTNSRWSSRSTCRSSASPSALPGAGARRAAQKERRDRGGHGDHRARGLEARGGRGGRGLAWQAPIRRARCEAVCSTRLSFPGRTWS